MLAALWMGNELLFILARDAQAEGTLQDGVVGTQMSNLGLVLALEALGIPFVRARSAIAM